MPIQPSGPLSLPLENLRVLLANCPAWQRWTQSDNADAAARRIHLVDIPVPQDGAVYTAEELDELRPLAVIDEYAHPNGAPGGDGWSSDRAGMGAFDDSGKLILRFEGDVPTEDRDDPAAAKLAFMNAVGAVIADLKTLGGGDTEFISIHRIARHQNWTRNDQTANATQGDHWSVTFLIDWGN